MKLTAAAPPLSKVFPMSSPLRLQRHFAGTMLRGSDRALASLVVPDRIAGERRLQIHRNHYRLTLTEALAATFPSLQYVLGETDFAILAAAYLRDHPPTTPCLHEYGGSFPAFAGGRSWLADLGRLDWTINRAYHAAELPALDPTRLAKVPPASIDDLVFTLQPSVGFVSSRVALGEVFEAIRSEAPRQRLPLAATGAHLLVARRELEVSWWALAEWEWRFLKRLADGESFGSAVHAAADHDVTRFLTGLIATGLLVAAFPSISKGPVHVANDDHARDDASHARR